MCIRNAVKQGDTETPRVRKLDGALQGLHHCFVQSCSFLFPWARAGWGAIPTSGAALRGTRWADGQGDPSIAQHSLIQDSHPATSGTNVS